MNARLCVVYWRDAHGVKDEGNREEVMGTHRPAMYWSAGVLVASDNCGVTIAQDLGLPLAEGYDTTFRTRTFIPRVLIDAEYDAGPLKRRRKRDPGETVKE